MKTKCLKGKIPKFDNHQGYNNENVKLQILHCDNLFYNTKENCLSHAMHDLKKKPSNLQHYYKPDIAVAVAYKKQQQIKS